ncbi:hypothetical protein NC651_039845 [Populus alba x Populus x berolinensis]|nr:hypothetical protein NC651_039845 [Populus alba x Populus x berolinensis]
MEVISLSLTLILTYIRVNKAPNFPCRNASRRTKSMSTMLNLSTESSNSITKQFNTCIGASSGVVPGEENDMRIWLSIRLQFATPTPTQSAPISCFNLLPPYHKAYLFFNNFGFGVRHHIITTYVIQPRAGKRMLGLDSRKVKKRTYYNELLEERNQEYLCSIRKFSDFALDESRRRKKTGMLVTIMLAMDHI